MPDLVGKNIGRYHLVEQLGVGGMATVYMAFDTHLERQVAIKVIRRDAFPAEQVDRVLKRFDREAKTLAQLTHPNIVGIIDYGDFEGSPYLVMEYLSGGTLKQRLGKPVPYRAALQLILPVAQALAFAHQKGVVHRDVKPANILITEGGQPMLTDFGIAKILEDDGGATLTGTGVGVGTPEYMAPEQGMGREIDERADVYALGVVLYELVTGRKPYTADTPMAVIFKHMTDPLPRPKETVPDMPDRVEQIIFKAMAKKPADRYQSMGEFAAALSTIDAQSMESAVTAGDSLPSSPLDESNMYEEETGEATVDMAEIPTPSPKIAESTRDAAISPSRQPSPSPVDISSQQVQQGLPEAYADETGEETSDFSTGIASTPQMIKPVVTDVVNPASLSPEKPAKVESQGSPGKVQKSRVENPPEVSHSPGKKDAPAQTKTAKNPWLKWALAAIGVVIIGAIVWGVSSSIAPAAVPTQATAQTFPMSTLTALPEVIPTQLSSGSVLIDSRGKSVMRLGDGTLNQIVYSPDGKILAVASSIGIYLYDAGSLEQNRFIDTGNYVTSVAISPDGRKLASGAYDKSIKLWDAESGALLQTLEGHNDGVTSVAFSPDGRRLASGSIDNTIRLWDAQSGALLVALEGHNRVVLSVAFSPDGRRLASGSYDSTIKLWDAENGVLLQTLEGHNYGVTSVAFSPDGRRLASGSNDNTIKLWDTQSGALLQTLEGHKEIVNDIAFSPDGRTLASSSIDNTIRLWDTQSGALVLTLEGHTNYETVVAFSPDGRRLASGSHDNTIKLWDAESGALLQTLEGHNDIVMSVAFSPDGHRLASGSFDKTIKLWDAENGVLLQTLEGHNHGVTSVAFSPDGRRLASGSYDNTIKLWDAESGALLQTLQGHSSYVSSVAFLPDGRRLATGSYDKTIKLWDAESGALLQTLEGHNDIVMSVAFSPDGRRLASGSFDKTIKLWDVESGTLLQTLEGHNGGVWSVAFSPDGRRLMSGSWDRTIKMWDAESGALLQTLEGHNDVVTSVAFSSDGRRLASGSSDNTIKLWDAESGALQQTLEGHSNFLTSVVFSPDNRKIASGAYDGTIRIWDIAED